MPEILLRDQNVSVGYGREIILANLNLQFAKSECWAFVGANGSGKSTYLRSVLEPQLIRGGKREMNVSPRKIAWLPQAPKLSWNLNATTREFFESCVFLARSVSRQALEQDIVSIEKMLQRLNLLKVADAPLGSLSGGQAQKLLFGRAFLMKAEILLLDEPFSAVDQESQAELLDILRESRSTTLQLIVVHDEHDAEACGAQLVRLAQGGAHVVPAH